MKNVEQQACEYREGKWLKWSIETLHTQTHHDKGTGTD